MVISDLVKALLSVRDEKAMESLLLGLFTPKELEELQQRLEIVNLLKQGIAQHEIAERLGVGVATVSRGSKELKAGRFNVI